MLPHQRTSYFTAITQESIRAVTLNLVTINRASSAMFTRSHHTRVETAVLNYIQLRFGLARIPKVVVYAIDDQILDGSEKTSSGTQQVCIPTSKTRFCNWKIIVSKFIKWHIWWHILEFEAKFVRLSWFLKTFDNFNHAYFFAYYFCLHGVCLPL